ncbi:MAG: hypothetical protein IKN63_02110 [Bacilli bacterium]|nr:hypothetical protein [Bacilli bacterium]
MQKIKKILKRNIKLLITLILGIIIPIIGVYASTIYYNGNEVGYSNANLTKNGQVVTNVQDALDALYNKATDPSYGEDVCTTSPFKLGDYVSYMPTSTSYSPNTSLRGDATAVTINPSELTLWRVIKINPNCTVEVVSEYVSTSTVQFKNKTGYLNYVYVLNEIAKQYADSSHTYTLDPASAPNGAFRNVGYDGATLQITNTTRIDNTSLGASGGLWYQKSTGLNGEESLGGGDQGFTTDLKLLSDAGVSIAAYAKGTTTPTEYWLASRSYTWNSTTDWGFAARSVRSYGYVGGYYLYDWDGSSFTSYLSNRAVRPVITLKSGLTVSGAGTSASPYVIN